MTSKEAGHADAQAHVPATGHAEGIPTMNTLGPAWLDLDDHSEAAEGDLSEALVAPSESFSPALVEGCLVGPTGLVQYQIGSKIEFAISDRQALGPNSEPVSVVFEFDRDESACLDVLMGVSFTPRVLSPDMHPQYLGTLQDYFAPGSAHCDLKISLFGTIPYGYGMLPVVRAVEAGIRSGRVGPDDVLPLAVEAMCEFWARRARRARRCTAANHGKLASPGA